MGFWISTHLCGPAWVWFSYMGCQSPTVAWGHGYILVWSLFRELVRETCFTLFRIHSSLHSAYSKWHEWEEAPQTLKSRAILSKALMRREWLSCTQAWCMALDTHVHWIVPVTIGDEYFIMWLRSLFNVRDKEATKLRSKPILYSSSVTSART